MQERIITTIVFDFDGTIADTLSRVIDIFNELAEKRNYLPIDKTYIRELRKKRIPEIMKSLGVPFERIPFVAHYIRKQITSDISDISPIPGIIELFQVLKKMNYTIGIISSNIAANIKGFCATHHLDYLDFIFFSKELFGKHRVIKKLIRKKNLLKEEILYVGDEIRDIEACKKIGVKIVSVSWGYNDINALAKEKPGFIARMPTDIITYLKKQGRNHS